MKRRRALEEGISALEASASIHSELEVLCGICVNESRISAERPCGSGDGLKEACAQGFFSRIGYQRDGR
jgi:hypothetical protein